MQLCQDTSEVFSTVSQVCNMCEYSVGCEMWFVHSMCSSKNLVCSFEIHLLLGMVSDVGKPSRKDQAHASCVKMHNCLIPPSCINQ